MMSGLFIRWFRSLKKTNKFHPAWIVMIVASALIVAGVIWIPVFLVSKADPSIPAPATVGTDKQKIAEVGQTQTPQGIELAAKPALQDASNVQRKFLPPDPDSIPAGQLGEVIRLGRNVFIDTQTYAREYVGNGLNCVNCHLDAGRKAGSAPLWGAYGMYPAYRDKNKKVNSYQDRLAGCFRFSMNGKAPASDSKVMLALVSYSAWLSTGAPVGVELEGRGFPELKKPEQNPDKTRGKEVFATNCALCHGANGEGTQSDGRYVFPPLWGPKSFNGGAGMSKVSTAAAFIKANMPLGKGGSLSLQDAWDVAQFMDSQERPVDPRK
jgi:thiosulfate dehydrogenase